MGDTEPVLFVNYKQAEFFEDYILGEQPERSDKKINIARCKILNDLFLLAG